jgi:uncharacterized membrane protein (UPF0127 family)
MRRGVILMAMLVAAAPACSHASAAPALPIASLTIQTTAGAVRLTVWVAQSDRARARGLMGRRHLDPNAGMAFLFERPSDGPFWMKDTLIPLSIAFWGPDRRIVAVLEMMPCQADPCPNYYPRVMYVGAVEATGGYFAAHAVRVGDPVALSG